jgi:formate dehydrogenase subunit beta
MSMWLLRSHNDPLAAIRGFLEDLWFSAGLEGMLVPIADAEHETVRYRVIHHPEELSRAVPAVPVMQSNAGRLVAELARERPGARLAAVLRACEVRAFNDWLDREAVDLGDWLIIGVDCLGSFPAQDFEWRVEKAGGVEALIRDLLRNARQGGIAPSRFRSACQMCEEPGPAGCDLCIDLMGLPVRDALMIGVRDEGLANELWFDQITDGPAPAAMIAEHEISLDEVRERRQRAREREVQALAPRLPRDLDELLSYLLACQPCTSCLEACPVLPDGIITALESGTLSHALARQWVIACAECGMCEQACPKAAPLAAIMNRISRELKQEALAI